MSATNETRETSLVSLVQQTTPKQNNMENVNALIRTIVIPPGHSIKSKGVLRDAIKTGISSICCLCVCGTIPSMHNCHIMKQSDFRYTSQGKQHSCVHISSSYGVK